MHKTKKTLNADVAKNAETKTTLRFFYVFSAFPALSALKPARKLDNAIIRFSAALE
jgi:hypothetical protein